MVESTKDIKLRKEQIKEAAEADLEFFIRLVHPMRMLGGIHSKVIKWWSGEDAKLHQLLLLPRDHQKSAMVGYRVAWEIIRNPSVRVLYISSTSTLAVKQLKFIKDILTCDICRFYWPEHVNIEEAKREKWTETEISIDHPDRKAEAIRDPTVFTAGLTTNITGLHFDVAVLDDVVVPLNAYTEEGRTGVEQQYSQLASIESAGAREWVVGTRYHPKDLYETMISKRIQSWDDDGNELDETDLYDVLQEQVESVGDGTGEFLWPKQRRPDGKWFGFDRNILEIKKQKYLDRVQFYAQYYNNPNDASGAGISSDDFQYFDRGHVKLENGRWSVKGRRINVFASIDFAFSLKKRADFTAIVVLGVDAENNYYVLDIDRFKTDMVSEYFDHIMKLHQKWNFNKLRAEVTVAQATIVSSLKMDYIRRHGLALSIDEYRPNRSEGTKEERIQATLRPRYQNKQVWHYQGGHCQTLEEELLLAHPPHDDVKDALTSCIDICVAPSPTRTQPTQATPMFSNSRFGGIA